MCQPKGAVSNVQLVFIVHFQLFLTPRVRGGYIELQTKTEVNCILLDVAQMLYIRADVDQRVPSCLRACTRRSTDAARSPGEEEPSFLAYIYGSGIL